MLIYLYIVFEKTAQRYFAGWPAGSSWGHLKDRWKSPGFRGRLDGSEGEWSGLRNATLVIVCTSKLHRKLRPGMPSEIVSAPCEMVPGTWNVTHKSFSIFECICETKRKNESENEKRGNI